MTVTCGTCGKQYDDLYRLTICPHLHFEMHTTVVGSDGHVRGVARTVEELRRMMEEPPRG